MFSEECKKIIMVIYTNMGIFVEEFMDRNYVLILMGMLEKLKSEFSFVT